MKDIPIYFTEESYNQYRNGGLAIGFTAEQRSYMQFMEREGIDCSLTSDPLECMTKVRHENVQTISYTHFGVYAHRKSRSVKPYFNDPDDGLPF